MLAEMAGSDRLVGGVLMQRNECCLTVLQDIDT